MNTTSTSQPDEVTREKWRREVGRARVQAALDHVQQAQVELNLAMMDLCSVIGYVGDGDKIAKLHQAVKAQWYRLNAAFERGPTTRHPEINELDHTPTADERSDPHAGGCGRRGWKESFFSDQSFSRAKEYEDLGLVHEGRVFRGTVTGALFLEHPTTKVKTKLESRTVRGVMLYPCFRRGDHAIAWVSVAESQGSVVAGMSKTERAIIPHPTSCDCTQCEQSRDL